MIFISDWMTKRITIKVNNPTKSRIPSESKEYTHCIMALSQVETQNMK